MYTRDSILYVRKAMIAAEFEESGSRYLQSLRSKEEVRMSLLQAEMQLVQHEENMLDIRKQAYDEEQSRRTDLKNAIEQLAAQLSEWEHSYLLKSSFNLANMSFVMASKSYSGFQPHSWRAQVSSKEFGHDSAIA